jgi:hypothetical protein
VFPVILLSALLHLSLYVLLSLSLSLSISLYLSLSLSLSPPPLFPDKKFPALDPSLVTSNLYSRLHNILVVYIISKSKFNMQIMICILTFQIKNNGIL